jgi:CubicO group peptidase (beta-lactamase class C family)
MDYNQFLEKALFTKLAMDHTHRLSVEKKPNQNVTGYVLKSEKLCSSDTNISSFYGQGDGDLMSTLTDLLKWNTALERGKILQIESTKLLWTPSKLENGKILETFPDSGVMYGLGWFIKEINGNKIVWTPGAGFGFSISSQYIPRYKLNIIVFCNRDQFLMADEIGFSIAKNLLQ